MLTFQDDDAGFFNWLDANEGGFFVNVREQGEYMLQGARCPHIDRSPNWRGTAKPKRCSPSRAALDQWVRGEGGTLTLCNECFN